MECSRCAATHGLYTYYQQPKGVSEIHYLWVSKQLMDELASLNKHNEWEREQFRTYFLERYGSTWHNHFAGKRKKAIWGELTENGHAYPSLSAFYSQINVSSLDKVLDRYLCYDESATVIRVLGLSDSTLLSRIKRIRGIEHAMNDKEAEILKKGVA